RALDRADAASVPRRDPARGPRQGAPRRRRGHRRRDAGGATRPSRAGRAGSRGEREDHDARRPATSPWHTAAAAMIRVGLGFDLPPLVAGRPLVLGGVTVPSEVGLDGHSDADVLSHAVAEALLGALALGDLGRHFPDNDPRWRGVSSLVLL